MKNFERLFLPFLIVIACGLVYSTGANGIFIFDDVTNIVKSEALHITELNWEQIRAAFYSGKAGLLKRPIPVLSFALNYYFAGGLDAYWFRIVNVVIHLINGLLAFIFFRLVCSVIASKSSKALHPLMRWLPLIAASIWLFHPLHVSSVLYVVQRMTLLSALFTLLALILYIKSRLKLNEKSRSWIFWLVAAFGASLLGVFSKENAALIPLFILLIEWVLFHFKTENTLMGRTFLILVIGVGVLLPLVAVLIYSLISPDWFLYAYGQREFTLAERLLTQARVIWIYMGWIVLPDIGNYGFHHDDILLSTHLLSPITTLVSIVALLLVFMGACFLREKLSFVVFGLFFYFIGHFMESSFIGLELVFEHRNYLPSLGICLAISYMLLIILSKVRDEKRQYKFATVSLALLLISMSASTMVRANKWEDPLYSSSVDVANHPESARSHHSYAVNLMRYTDVSQNEQLIRHHLSRSAELDEDGVGSIYVDLLLYIALEQVAPDSLLEEFKERLARQKSRAETVHFLNGLIAECLKIDCSDNLDTEELGELLETARSNLYNQQFRHIEFSLLWVNYLVAYKKDIYSSIPVLKEIIALDPDYPATNSYLLQVYAAGRSHDEKQSLINMLKQTKFAVRNPMVVDRFERQILEAYEQGISSSEEAF